DRPEACVEVHDPLARPAAAHARGREQAGEQRRAPPHARPSRVVRLVRGIGPAVLAASRDDSWSIRLPGSRSAPLPGKSRTGGRRWHGRCIPRPGAEAATRAVQAPTRTLEGTLEVWPGRPFPLGATYDGAGTNFSIFSEVAEGVELCLFD